MGKMQRDKGARGENEVVDISRAHGFTAVRTRSGGGQKRCDVAGIPAHVMEVKYGERLRIWEALEQAHAAAGPGETPAVAFRRSNRPRNAGGIWHVAVPLDDYLALVAAREMS